MSKITNEAIMTAMLINVKAKLTAFATEMTKEQPSFDAAGDLYIQMGEYLKEFDIEFEEAKKGLEDES